MNIIFGHWSTLRPSDTPGIYPIDTGCLWGGQLTALRIDIRPERTELPCRGWLKPNNG
jgi:bis(5'-nucleosyl)-tetraphosphatase (symmetrical)